MQKRVILTIVLLAATFVSALVPFYFNYLSTQNAAVRSAALRIYQSSHRLRGPHNLTITFFVEAVVSLNDTGFDPTVKGAAFSLAVDSYPLGALPVPVSIFKPIRGFGDLRCIVYRLTFQADNSTVANSLSQRSTNSVLLQMTGTFNLPLYKERISLSSTTSIKEGQGAIIDYICPQVYELPLGSWGGS